MKKIIFITRCFNATYNTGAARTVADAAFSLANLGWHVHLVVGQGYQDRKDKLKNENTKGVFIHRIWTLDFPCTSSLRRVLNYFIFYLSCAYSLIRLVRSEDIVVVTTDPPLISVIVDVIVRLRGATLVNWLLDIYPEMAERLGFRLAKGWRLHFLRFLRNISWKNAKMNVVLGERMLDFVIEQGIPKNKICIQPNWEDGTLIQGIDVDQDNALKKEWLLEDKFVIGYSGNMGRAYDFNTLLKVAKLLEIEEKIIFLFVGNGYYRPYIEEVICKDNLKNVFLKPYQPPEKLKESLSIPHIHVLSTLTYLEGLLVPGKLYSAMAVGRPIIFIGDEQGEVARTITRFNCGRVVPIGDTQALIKMILMLYNDRSLCETFGRNARLAFTQHFDKAIAMQRWHALLESI